MTADTGTRTVTIVPVEGPPAVLYHRYAGQSGPQDCFIALNLLTGRTWAEVGTSLPFLVDHGIVRHWPIPPLQPATANAIMQAIEPYAQAILENSSLVWHGYNRVAYLDRAAVMAEKLIAGDGIPFKTCGPYGRNPEWHDGIFGILNPKYLESDVCAEDPAEWLVNVERKIKQRIAAGESLDVLHDEYQGDGARDDAPYLDGLMPYLEQLADTVRAEAQDAD